MHFSPDPDDRLMGPAFLGVVAARTGSFPAFPAGRWENGTHCLHGRTASCTPIRGKGVLFCSVQSISFPLPSGSAIARNIVQARRLGGAFTILERVQYGLQNR